MCFIIEPLRQRGLIHANPFYTVNPSIIDDIANTFQRYYPQILMMSQSNELHLIEDSNQQSDQQYIINLETLNHLLGLPSLDDKFDIRLKYKDGSDVYDSTYSNQRGGPLPIKNKLIDYLDYFIQKISYAPVQPIPCSTNYPAVRNQIVQDFNDLKREMGWITSLLNTRNNPGLFMGAYLELIYGSSRNISVYQLLENINKAISHTQNASQLAELNSFYQTIMLNFQRLNSSMEQALSNNNTLKNMLVEWLLNRVPNNILLSDENAIESITNLIENLHLPINISVTANIRNLNTDRVEFVKNQMQIQPLKPELDKLVMNLMLDMIMNETLTSTSPPITISALETELQRRNIPYTPKILNEIHEELNSIEIEGKIGEEVMITKSDSISNQNLNIAQINNAEFIILIDENHQAYIDDGYGNPYPQSLLQIGTDLANSKKAYTKKYDDEYEKYHINSSAIPNPVQIPDFNFSNFSSTKDSNNQSMTFQQFLNKWNSSQNYSTKHELLEKFGLIELLYFLLVEAKDQNGVPIKEYIKQELSPNLNLTDQLNWERIAPKVGIVEMFANFYNSKMYILNDNIIIQQNTSDREYFLHYKYQNVGTSENQELHSLSYHRSNPRSNLQTVSRIIQRNDRRTGKTVNITDQIKDVKLRR